MKLDQQVYYFEVTEGPHHFSIGGLKIKHGTVKSIHGKDCLIREDGWFTSTEFVKTTDQLFESRQEIEDYIYKCFTKKLKFKEPTK